MHEVLARLISKRTVDESDLYIVALQPESAALIWSEQDEPAVSLSLLYCPTQKRKALEASLYRLQQGCSNVVSDGTCLSFSLSLSIPIFFLAIMSL